MIVNEFYGPSRRAFLKKAFGSMAIGAAGSLGLYGAFGDKDQEEKMPDNNREKFRITKMEVFKIKPRWLFLKIHPDQGITGWGEPVVEGRADTVATAVMEIEPYLLGQDPRRVIHHWQAIYRHAFYRGGPVLTSALSGVEQALWDIKGKALGVPIYELLGGPTRHHIRVYSHAHSMDAIRKAKSQGFTAFKTGVLNATQSGVIANSKFIGDAVARFAMMREAVGDDADIGIDFHGAISPQNASLLIHELEPFKPWFIEEPVNCQNVDVMAGIASKTHIPIATGERIFTKWGFREILEKGAASILQPDLSHAGGIFETRLIAGMAEAYYASMAPHNPLGPISLAAGIQLSASIPNFLCQEQVSLGEGYLKRPFEVINGHIPIPEGPGLGIELDEEAIAEKLGHDWKSPQPYLDTDGSVVDW